KTEWRDEFQPVTTLANVLWRNGVILGADGQISLMRPDEAVLVFQQAFDAIEEIAKKDSNDASGRILFIQVARELGNILNRKNPEGALSVFDHALLRVREVKNNARARRGEAQLLAASSYPLRSLHRIPEARQHID